jgi:hypothetical protein
MPINLLNTKSASILETWNVRTMYQSGKAAQIAKEMHKYKIEVMGLSETRWISTGKTILATGEVVLYSGVKGLGHRVKFLLHNILVNTLESTSFNVF